MSNSSQDFDGLAEQVQRKADDQHAKLNAALNAKNTGTTKLKLIALAFFLMVFGACLYLQYPHFSEPFEWPDPQKESSVAEAELEVAGGLIEAFKIAQGRLPSSLDEVSLPQALRQRAASASLTYDQINGNYVLTWITPHFKVQFDGASGGTKVTSSGKN